MAHSYANPYFRNAAKSRDPRAARNCPKPRFYCHSHRLCATNGDGRAYVSLAKLDPRLVQQLRKCASAADMAGTWTEKNPVVMNWFATLSAQDRDELVKLSAISAAPTSPMSNVEIDADTIIAPGTTTVGGDLVAIRGTPLQTPARLQRDTRKSDEQIRAMMDRRLDENGKLRMPREIP